MSYRYDFNGCYLNIVLRLLPSRPANGTPERGVFNQALDSCGGWTSMESTLREEGVSYSDFSDSCASLVCGGSNNPAHWAIVERGIRFLAGLDDGGILPRRRSPPLILEIT